LDGSTYLLPLSITAAEKPEELPLHTEEPQHEKPQTEVPTSEATSAQVVLEGLRVSSVTPNSVQLQWSVPKGSFNSFMLQYRDAHGQPQALPIDGTSRSVMVSGLSPSHRYRFHLYGLWGGKRIDRVSTDTVTGEAETREELVPSAEPKQEKLKTESPAFEALPAQAVLGELKISSVTPKSVQLQWSISEGSFDSFMLQYRDAQGQPQALPIDGESRLMTVPGLSPSHQYHFHLYGLRDRKKIDHVSTEVMTEEPQHEKPQTESPTTGIAPPQAILEDLRVSSIKPGSVQLQWSIPKGSFDSFILQYRDAQGQPQALSINGEFRSVTVP
ncbi:TENX protein, partial [Catharus fuscescens]|nr:TENX protein [Catharus fuscescens]